MKRHQFISGSMVSIFVLSGFAWTLAQPEQFQIGPDGKPRMTLEARQAVVDNLLAQKLKRRNKGKKKKFSIVKEMWLSSAPECPRKDWDVYGYILSDGTEGNFPFIPADSQTPLQVTADVEAGTYCVHDLSDEDIKRRIPPEGLWGETSFSYLLPEQPGQEWFQAGLNGQPVLSPTARQAGIDEALASILSYRENKDASIVRVIPLVPKPDFPEKDLDVVGYELSNGTTGYILCEYADAAMPPPSWGFHIEADVETGTYTAREGPFDEWKTFWKPLIKNKRQEEEARWFLSNEPEFASSEPFFSFLPQAGEERVRLCRASYHILP